MNTKLLLILVLYTQRTALDTYKTVIKQILNIVPANFCYQEWHFISLIVIAAVRNIQLVI